MREGYGIRLVYTQGHGYAGEHPTVKDLADEMAKDALGFFGNVDETEEHVERLSKHLIAEAVSWVNNEFDLGLR